MPFYNYKCGECLKEFTALKKISESDDPMPCECGGIGVRTVTAPAYVVVKGPLHKKMRYGP